MAVEIFSNFSITKRLNFFTRFICDNKILGFMFYFFQSNQYFAIKFMASFLLIPLIIQQ